MSFIHLWRQQIGLLRRIKSLLPRKTRELSVKSMVIPILDYADIVWGDKSNSNLMAKVQALQNKGAKLILGRLIYSSASEGLQSLGLVNMAARRRCHCLMLIHKGINGLIDWNLNFMFSRDVHSHDTRFKNNIRVPQSRHSRG